MAGNNGTNVPPALTSGHDMQAQYVTPNQQQQQLQMSMQQQVNQQSMPMGSGDQAVQQQQHQFIGQQQHQSAGAGPVPVPGPQKLPQHTSQPPAQIFSGSQLCRLGQDLVQDIVNRTMELFNNLKASQPPNGTKAQLVYQAERKKRIAEALEHISLDFKKLRKVCEKVNETTTDMEFVQIESLIPIRESGELRTQEEKKKNSEIVRRLTEERDVYANHLRAKNRKLKDIIDMLRDIVWDINTMLAMRKP